MREREGERERARALVPCATIGETPQHHLHTNLSLMNREVCVIFNRPAVMETGYMQKLTRRLEYEILHLFSHSPQLSTNNST